MAPLTYTADAIKPFEIESPPVRQTSCVPAAIFKRALRTCSAHCSPTSVLGRVMNCSSSSSSILGTTARFSPLLASSVRVKFIPTASLVFDWCCSATQRHTHTKSTHCCVLSRLQVGYMVQVSVCLAFPKTFKLVIADEVYVNIQYHTHSNKLSIEEEDALVI